MARNVQATLDGRFKTYADLLRGTASLFLATDQVTREAFRHYVAGLDLPHHFPGVESINFAHYVLDAERARFEAQMLQNIDGRGRNARIKPAGRRAEYTVLTFVEPGTGLGRADRRRHAHQARRLRRSWRIRATQAKC